MVIWVVKMFLYSSSEYSCHLFLISSAGFCPLSCPSLHEIFPWYLQFSSRDLYSYLVLQIYKLGIFKLLTNGQFPSILCFRITLVSWLANKLTGKSTWIMWGDFEFHTALCSLESGLLTVVTWNGFASWVPEWKISYYKTCFRKRKGTIN